MDGNRFDVLARRLGQLGTRRAAFAALAGLAVPPSEATARRRRRNRRPDGSCRFPGIPCRIDANCCEGMTCRNGTCQCAPGLTPCGDFCVADPGGEGFGDCCKPYGSACDPDDAVPCCSDQFSEQSDCRGTIDGERVCCGLYFHPCTPETASICCSGECGDNGRCVAEPAPSVQRRGTTPAQRLPDRPGAAPRREA